MLARLYHHLQQPDKACQALEAHVTEFPMATKATHINILAELYMDSKEFSKAADLIERTAALTSAGGGPLIDLQVLFLPLGRF